MWRVACACGEWRCARVHDVRGGLLVQGLWHVPHVWRGCFVVVCRDGVRRAAAMAGGRLAHSGVN